MAAENSNLELLRIAVRPGRIEWQGHALERMVKREILRSEVKEVLLHGIRIKDYPADYRFPSALFPGKPGKRALHLVAAFDEEGGKAYVITADEPDFEHFEHDLKKRREK